MICSDYGRWTQFFMVESGRWQYRDAHTETHLTPQVRLRGHRCGTLKCRGQEFRGPGVGEAVAGRAKALGGSHGCDHAWLSPATRADSQEWRQGSRRRPECHVSTGSIRRRVEKSRVWAVADRDFLEKGPLRPWRMGKIPLPFPQPGLSSQVPRVTVQS